MSITPATRAQIAGLSQADFIEWSDLFNVGVAIPVGAGLALVTTAMRAFNLTHPALLVSRVQGGAASQFNGDFRNGDSVLVTQNTRGPIVLVFDPPITALGANVQSPVGAAVTMEVWCRGAKKAQPFHGIGVLQHLGKGLAPFLGGISDKSNIVRVEFHVDSAGALPADLGIAVNRVELA